MRPLFLLSALLLARSAGAVGNSGGGVDDKMGDEAIVAPNTLACLAADEECDKSADATAVITKDGRAAKVAVPMFGVQGNFERLFDAYLHGTVDDVKETIGRPTESWITNTCVIRVSYAMNNSGVPGFKIDRSFVGATKKINFINQKAVARKSNVQNAVLENDFAYIYRVDEMAAYMLKKYGKPQIWAKKGTDNLRQAVHGKRGIILFVVRGWNDATGHFDLWDGRNPAHQEFFDKASDVFLWQ